MKVCLVNLAALPALSHAHKHERVGGEEVQHAQLATALARRGHDVHLVVADYGQPEGLRIDGVTVHKAFRESEGVPVLRFVHPRWTKLWAAIGRANADVYYCSCAGMLVGLLAMFCGLHRRRLVFRVASDADCYPDRLLVRHARDRWLYEYGLRRADATLVQSVTQQSALLANYGRESTVAGMLVVGPDPAAVRSAKDIDVLWVANIRRVKRPDRLLELARLLPQVNFVMAGGASPGEEALYGQIECEARTIPNLRFLGPVPYLDIGPLFGRARVFANTSEVEGFPNTFLQSWIRGVPVVTLFDPDGLVRSRQLGSAHDNVAEMATGAAKLLDDPALEAIVSSRVREFMAQHYGEETVLGPYLAALGGGPMDVETLSARPHRPAGSRSAAPRA